MTDLLSLDVRAYRALHKRLALLQSYQGTSEEMDGDRERIDRARAQLRAFLSDAIDYHGSADWAEATRDREDDDAASD